MNNGLLSSILTLLIRAVGLLFSINWQGKLTRYIFSGCFIMGILLAGEMEIPISRVYGKLEITALASANKEKTNDEDEDDEEGDETRTD